MNIQYYAADGTVKNLGDDELQHWKYIKKIKTGSGWRYFYTPEELRQFYNEGKKKADSIPRIQKHDNGKYYIANKKQQKNIQKNIEYSRKLNRRSARYNDAAEKDRRDMNARKRFVDANKKTGTPSTRTVRDEKGRVLYTRKDPTAKDVANKAMSYSINKAKSEAARSAAESVYNRTSKYEAKNVLTKPFSSVKNKLKKKNKGKKKAQEKYTVTTRTIKEKRTPINEVTLKNGTTTKYNTNKKRKKSK